MELEDLLAVPGMSTLIDVLPIIGGALFLVVATLLWRNGFNDLIEQATRTTWSPRERLHAVAMLPGRAILLTLAAAIGAATTTIGLAFNIAVLINIWFAIRTGLAG